MRARVVKVFMVFAAVSIAAVLFGQAVISSITSTVADNTGAVIPGATVTVSDQAQGVNRVTTTNSAGSYLVAAIPSGTYNLTIEAKSFKTYRAAGIVIQAAEKIRADATLQVGAVSTQITVQGSKIGQLQTQTSQLGGTVTGRQITQLELNGRSFVRLLNVGAGSRQYDRIGFGTLRPSLISL